MPAPTKIRPARNVGDSPVKGRKDLSSGSRPYPAKLVAGGQKLDPFDVNPSDYWLSIEFERPDRVWASDGNPVKAFITQRTTWDGEPAFENDDMRAILDAFDTLIGVDALEEAAFDDYMGHWFMLEDQDTGRVSKKSGKTVYAPVPTEYLGEDYAFKGKVTQVGGENGAAPAGASEEEDAAQLAGLFHGIPVTDLKGGAAMELVKSDEYFAGVNNVLGLGLRGGLVKPRATLIDKLIAEGYATNEDGVFTTAS